MTPLPVPTKIAPCAKCFGSGWCWASELNDYDHERYNASFDKTKYTCDECNGNKYVTDPTHD